MCFSIEVIEVDLLKSIDKSEIVLFAVCIFKNPLSFEILSSWKGSIDMIRWLDFLQVR